jgi:hypothetical protein
MSIVLMVISREKAWWERGPFWVIKLLNDAADRDDDEKVRYSANELLKAFLAQESHKETQLLTRSGLKSIESIEMEALKRPPGETLPPFVPGLKARIQAWGESVSPPHGRRWFYLQVRLHRNRAAGRPPLTA